jgi:hypothetical protein
MSAYGRYQKRRERNAKRSILQVRADQDALPRRTADEAKDPASIATLGEFI